jgi:hypothetical protein
MLEITGRIKGMKGSTVDSILGCAFNAIDFQELLESAIAEQLHRGHLVVMSGDDWVQMKEEEAFLDLIERFDNDSS